MPTYIVGLTDLYIILKVGLGLNSGIEDVDSGIELSIVGYVRSIMGLIFSDLTVVGSAIIAVCNSEA